MKRIVCISVAGIIVMTSVQVFGWVWPMSGRITSVVGPRWGSYHYGTDIAAPTGTGIGNAGRGTVTVAGWVGGYGNAVYIDHSAYAAGWTTRYGHLSKIYVRVGQKLTQFNQTIGACGSTGNSTGPHLHWEIRYYGTAKRPSCYVEQYVKRGTTVTVR
ncbi:MAG: M23 family metallopeptidase [Endomicrobia bacterium]|nr:M23 family metallopeptidase [Endomicrobiia bacterium]